MEYCLDNPADAIRGIGPEADARQYVIPVGRAASARMPGVMGNIPVGSETSMLDVIAEMNALIRR